MLIAVADAASMKVLYNVMTEESLTLDEAGRSPSICKNSVIRIRFSEHD